MLDGGLASAQSENPVPAGEALRNRLFAFSTVSGSSVGAVMATAAMAASAEKQPCTRQSPLWYGATGPIRTWRDCLESLMAGDFLTPIFTGFVFHDVLRFIGWQDRGVLLEHSLEDQFKTLIGHPPSTPDAACTGDLRCPFMALRPNQSRWLPILVLNSTSVTTGQRIIMTSLERDYQSVAAKCPLEPRLDKTPLCPLFESGKMLREWLTPPEDFKLSTAAHNSARFPLLSPPGELHDGKGQLVDWIVDGGYFENLGVQTATEIAEAITAVDGNLKPFILVITNDPTLRYGIKERSRMRKENEKERVAPTIDLSRLPQRSQTDVTEPPATSSLIMDADSARSRPRFRNEAARHSEIIPPTVPR
jgi:predicted acylesterase/phospholipase RssA